MGFRCFWVCGPFTGTVTTVDFVRFCNCCQWPFAAIWIPHHSFIGSIGLTLEELDHTISVIYPGHSIIRLLLRPSEVQYSTKRCQWYSAWVTSLKSAQLGKSLRWCRFESPGDQGFSLQILNVLPVSVWVWHSSTFPRMNWITPVVLRCVSVNGCLSFKCWPSVEPGSRPGCSLPPAKGRRDRLQQPLTHEPAR